MRGHAVTAKTVLAVFISVCAAASFGAFVKLISNLFKFLQFFRQVGKPRILILRRLDPILSPTL